MTNPYSAENNLLGYGEIARLIAEDELTDELRNYWREKYVTLLKAGFFEISEEVLTSFSEPNLDMPITPSGKINLCRHLNKENKIDEQILQNTVETAIRMLDSLIEKIPFNPKNKELVKKNRKLNLEIKDFKEYLAINKEQALQDYIGGLVSNFAYRASESLAEEKGQCPNWASHSKSLKSKPFEYWYNIYNGEIKSSLEILSGNVKVADYEIIPRRNSHLLGFLGGIWTDREAVITPNKELLNQNSLTKVENIAENTENKVFLESPESDKIEITNNKIQDIFNYQMGELVKIVDSQNPKFGKVYQVVELIIPSKYKLAGEKSLISQVWSQDSLESVDLLEILNKVNHQNTNSSGQIQNKIQELISEKQTLLEQLEKTLAEKLELESLNLELKKSLEIINETTKINQISDQQKTSVLSTNFLAETLPELPPYLAEIPKIKPKKANFLKMLLQSTSK